MRHIGFGFIIGILGSAFALDVPKELTYHHKPIDALCFSLIGEVTSDKIDLRNCGITHNAYSSEGQNEYLTKQGFIGTDWKDSKYNAHGFGYYKYFDAGDGDFWIYSVNNSGGSGDFSSLMLVKRHDENTLTFKTYFGGDRCNGGLADVVKDGNGPLKVSVNLTPIDVYAPDSEKPSKLAAYDDLAACASCCIAKANFEVSKQHSIFQGIAFNPFQSIDELPEQGKYQKCFNQVVMNYVKQGKSELTKQLSKQFIEEFNQTCLD